MHHLCNVPLLYDWRLSTPDLEVKLYCLQHLVADSLVTPPSPSHKFHVIPLVGD